MPVKIILYWAVAAGNTYTACYKEAALAQVCVPAVAAEGGQHVFPNLKEDTDYSFSYKVNGDESAPFSTHTQKKTPPAPSALEK